jgi:hypothetical protein
VDAGIRTCFLARAATKRVVQCIVASSRSVNAAPSGVTLERGPTTVDTASVRVRTAP